jgi:hypothetical protein
MRLSPSRPAGPPRVFKVLRARDTAVQTDLDGDDVEADRTVSIRVANQIFRGDGFDLAAFLPGHCLFGTTASGPCPDFNFDEHEPLAPTAQHVRRVVPVSAHPETIATGMGPRDEYMGQR